MLQSPQQRQPAGTTSARGGFTLIELLVVIAIIGLLAGILIPTVQSISSQGYRTRTTAHMAVLDKGAQQYHADNGVYPGQKNWGNWSTDTASQMLVRYLFTPKEDNPFGSGWEPEDAYVGNPPENLLDETGNEVGKKWAPMDGFPRPMAICYWPAHPDRPGSVKQFSEGQNSSLLTNKEGNLDKMVRNDKTGIPHGDGKYIFIAAGEDRVFFTTDDVTSWKKD
ncbi:MAG: type II secretion system protein [Planctomycetota bacterium]